jgi:molecular chaperone GrpE
MVKQPKHKDEPQDGRNTEVDELTNDLKRIRADFENYRKRVEQEKAATREAGEAGAILKLLPVIDNIERAIAYIPEDLKGNSWADGVANLVKNLEKALQGLGLERIEAQPGTDFNPELHDAIQVDEESEGDREVVAEELQPGYRLHGRPIRHAMVKVTRTQTL